MYTTIGSVRGGCGHRHRSIEAAERCIRADNRAVKRSGPHYYSDRTVWAISATADLRDQERIAERKMRGDRLDLVGVDLPARV